MTSSHLPAKGALAGIRILDFTHVLAGPFATRILGDMGADVVKVTSAARPGNIPGHPYYAMWNRNKRNLALDLSREDGRVLGRRLAEKADIVIDNFSVGVLDRWGMGYDTVRETNRGVSYVQMSGMGDGGPWSEFVTYAPTVHALSGLTYLTGLPGHADIGIGVSYNDHASGLHGALAVLAAVEARRESGEGQRIDLAQFEVGVNFAGPSLLDLFANGRTAHPSGNRLPYDVAAPHNCYPCLPTGPGLAGERWIAIACMDDAQWHTLRKLMGNPAWAEDERYNSATGRTANVGELDKHVAQWTKGMVAEEIMAICQANEVPAGVVQSGVDLAEMDPQLALDNFLAPVDDSEPQEAGTIYRDRLPLYFAKTPADSYRRHREVGQDNVDVLSDWLAMGADEVRQGEEDGLLT